MADHCATCGKPLEVDRIFCERCGAASSSIAPLLPKDSIDAVANVGALRRISVVLLKCLKYLVVVVFVLCPLRTLAWILVFAASITLFLICHILLNHIDDDYAAEREKGYWPQKPIN
jgi:hypothetical protein